VVVVFRWTGVYLGAHVGGGKGFKEESSVPFPFAGFIYAPLPASVGVGGWLAGGQVGANYQIDSWVLGIEAQASWASLTGSSTCGASILPVIPPGAGGASCSAKIDTLGTAAVRLGVAFDRLLLYGKGGAAWTNDNYQVLLNSGFKPLLFSANELRWGWMAGIGVEYAFTDNWTAKIEYNYMDLGTDSLHFADTLANVFIDTNIRERVNVVKVGVNYRFGVSPILIK
jgi:opacity protein-like surface antigen